MLQKCNHANNLYTAAKKLSFTYLKAARKMDWQQSEGQLVKADTTAKLKQEINCFFFKLLHSVQWVSLCSKSVVMLNTYNSSQKVIVHVSESGQKNGLAASRGSISQSWHCSKIKTRAGAVLCPKVRTILWWQRRGGGAVSACSISYLAGKKGLFQIEFLFIYLSAEQLSWKTTWVMPAI